MFIMLSRPAIARALLTACLTVLSCLAAGCDGSAAGPSACDGLADKKVAITRTDYSACAGEILDTLQALEEPLRRLVDGDASARVPAQSASRRLSHLMGQVGFQADAWREVQGGAGRAIERWPDAGMRGFNAEVVNAAAQFRAVLAYPNQDNLQQGIRLNAEARNAYSRFR